MNSEQQFADWINEAPEETGRQLVYADWLDEQCDPRAEAWRVLIEAGRRPEYKKSHRLHLWTWCYTGKGPHHLEGFVCWYAWLRGSYQERLCYPRESFFDGMNSAAIAWVRFHSDPDYLVEPIESIPPPENPSHIETANAIRDQVIRSLGVPSEIIQGDERS